MSLSVPAIAYRLVSAGDWVRRLAGWRRFLFALAAGLLSALAFPPFGLFPLLLLSFAALVLLLDGAQLSPHPIRSGAAVGWAYGFGQFAAGLYWVAYAFLVDPLQHAWQIPFVAMLFPGGLALFLAAACAVSAWLWRPGSVRICIFTICYVAAEWLRGHILTGFPWNLPGYGWSASLAILQSVSLFGVYGLTLLTVLLGASLALFCDRDQRATSLPFAMFALFAVLWTFGAVRLASPRATVPGIHLRIVQPNVPQDQKYVAALRLAHWRELIALSHRKAATEPNIIIWPEAAPPFLLAQSPAALDDIAILTGSGRTLVTGAVRAERNAAGKLIVHNSVYVFGHGGALLGTYDKFHLVPFGEYVPFPDTLHALGIDRLVNQPGSFAGGDGPHTFAIPGIPPFGTLICYEILFPGEVVDESHRPGWFINVTDDSWFGPASSSGPHQHFLVARVRAIEEGLPVVRAANTGISAVIDSQGRVVAQLSVDRAGVVDSLLPVAQTTVFAHFGHSGFLLMLLVLTIVTGLLTISGGRAEKPFSGLENSG